MTSSSLPLVVPPMDEYNRALVGYAHPPDWQNPLPPDRYDLLVVGAGPAGLVAAVGAAGLGLGLKVALVERHLLGGDCLNVGCVPSKALIRSARAAADVREADRFGVRVPGEPEPDFAAAMTRLRRIRAAIAPHDSADRFAKLGIDVFLGEASFVAPDAVRVGEQTLRFKKAVVATGARATTPKLPGLAEAGFLTNETVFSLTSCPRRLAVVGGGPIGCELAQAFQRLGAQVVLFQRGAHLLPREDPDAAAIVAAALARDGVRVVLGAQLARARRTATGKVLEWAGEDGPQSVEVDEILVGAGRSPNVEALNLAAAGIDCDRRGIAIDDFLQTSNRKVFAAGDVCMDWKFTHAADAAARIVLKNALFSPFGLGKSRLSELVVPWATYTDPEVARVGLSEVEARAKNLPVRVIRIDFADLDRARTDGETEGFLKVLHGPKSDKILGATLVSRHAGEIVGELATAMTLGLGLSKLSNVIHPYPTQAECVRKAADAYRRTLLTPRTQKLLGILTRLS